jgi:hypothetical protein
VDHDGEGTVFFRYPRGDPHPGFLTAQAPENTLPTGLLAYLLKNTPLPLIPLPTPNCPLHLFRGTGC